MNRRISKELAYFLKKNGIYTNFMKYNRGSILPIVTLQSFNWTESDEGYLFWMGVSSDYFTYLAKKVTEHLKESLLKDNKNGYN